MRGPSSRPPLRISQATFDDAVASNMEAFEHERPEAVAAARAQFAAAGVDLSNIVDSVEDASTPASAALAALAILVNVLASSPAADDDQHGALLSAALRGVALALPPTAATPSPDPRSVLADRGGVATVCTALTRADSMAHTPSLSAGCDALRALVSRTGGDAADGARRLVDDATVQLLLRNAAPRGVNGGGPRAGSVASADSEVEWELQRCVLFLSRGARPRPAVSFSPPPPSPPPFSFSACMLTVAELCVRRESIKDLVFACGGSALIAGHITRCVAAAGPPPCPPPPAPLLGLVRDACTLLAKCVQDDDMLSLASKSYDRARQLAVEGLPTLLLDALDVFVTDDGGGVRGATSAELFTALRAVAVNDEICRGIDDGGGVARVSGMLAKFVGGGGAGGDAGRLRLVRCGLAVLRSLAHSDSVKASMVFPPGGGVPPVRLALGVLDTWTDASVLEQAAALVGNVVLRLPANADAVGGWDGVRLLCRAMRTDPRASGLQRASALALRNLVARSPARATAALDEGAEALLLLAYGAHPATCGDVAYAALRDLGCAVESSIGREQAERVAAAGGGGR